MTKINRRDYLIRMGAAAGAIAGAPKLDLFAKQQRRNIESISQASHSHSKQRDADPEDPLDWHPKVEWPELPTKECVKIIFHGLMGFCPRKQPGSGATHCDIGFHLKGDSNHHHRLSIYAYQNPDCVRKLAVENLKGVNFELTIDKPDTEGLGPGVAFYQPSGSVKRRKELAHKNDFRWIVDFESNYLYGKYLGGKVLEKNKNVYKPTVTITNGLFYTLRKTASTFRAQTRDGELVSDLGNIADIIGANVYLADGGTVTLRVAGSEARLQAPAELYLINHCNKHPDNPDRCEPKPYDLEDKKNRSDFFLNYKAFNRNGMREYELFLADSYGEPEELQVCRKKFFTDSDPQRLTDRAPCAGVGYGGGEGLPVA